MEGNGSSGRTKEVPVDEALEQMARQAYDDGAATRMGDSPDTAQAAALLEKWEVLRGDPLTKDERGWYEHWVHLHTVDGYRNRPFRQYVPLF